MSFSKTPLLLLGICLGLLACQPKSLTLAASTPVKTSAPSQPLSQCSNAFGLLTYQQLAQSKTEENLFFSPLSISSALWMAHSGARTETAREMSEALQLTQSTKEIEADYQAFIKGLEQAKQGKNAPKLKIANGLCVTGGGIAEDYQNLLKTSYQAELFSGGTKEINQWVSKKTSGKIPTLLSQLPPDSAAVLLNAIYFKGTWASSFEKSQTQDKDFFSSQGKMQVPMMSQETNFRLLEQADFQLISLPYQDSSLSLQVLLPREGKSLTEVEQQFTLPKLQVWQSQLQEQRFTLVNLELPKFKLETKYDPLNPELQKLGIKQAFNCSQADFSGMGGKPGDLWIDRVIHKAFLEIDEEGTEAAAATAIVLQRGRIPEPPKPKTFHANRPFLFWIQEDQSGTLLFLGRYTNPE